MNLTNPNEMDNMQSAQKKAGQGMTSLPASTRENFMKNDASVDRHATMRLPICQYLVFRPRTGTTNATARAVDGTPQVISGLPQFRALVPFPSRTRGK